MTDTRDAFEAHWRSIQSPSKANRELNQRDGNEYAHGHVARHRLTWQTATLAERERCAKLCDDENDFSVEMKNRHAATACEHLAGQIRTGK